MTRIPTFLKKLHSAIFQAAVAISFAVFLLSASHAFTQDWASKFQEAETAYRGRTQSACIPLFQALAEQMEHERKNRLLNADELALLSRSLDYLGQTYFNLNEQDKARETFLRLIRINSEYRMDEALTSTKLITLFQALKQENLGILSVRSSPPGATVRLDEYIVGATDLGEARVLQGTHELEVSKPGFAVQKKTVTIVPGSPVEVTVELRKDERRYEVGLEQLRSFNAPAARAEFERLLEADPSNVQARSALSEALWILGYERKAREEAEKALAEARELSAQDDLLLQGRASESAGEWGAAATAYAKRLAAQRNSVDDAVRLARVQIQAGRGKDGLETVVNQQLNGSQDPRLRLLQAEAAGAVSDSRTQLEAAGECVRKGQLLKSPFLTARAFIQEGLAYLRMKETETADAAFRNALQVPEIAQDPLARALAHMGLGNLMMQKNNAAAAEKEYLAARDILRDVEHRSRMGQALYGLGNAQAAQQNYAEAKTQLTAAAQLLSPADPLRAQVLFRLGVTLLALGDAAAAKPNLESALKLARQSGDKAIISGSLFHLGSLPGYPEADRMNEEAAALLRELRNTALEAEAQLRLAESLEKRKDFPAAQQRYERVLTIYRETGNRGQAALILNRLGYNLMRQGRKADAGERFREAGALFQELGDGRAAQRAQEDIDSLKVEDRNRVVLLLQRGFEALNAKDYAGAATAYEEALKLAGDFGDFESQANALNSLGFVLSRQGDDTGAKERWQQALDAARQGGDKRAEALALFNLSTAEYNLGNQAEATKLYDQSAALYREIGEQPRPRPW